VLAALVVSACVLPPPTAPEGPVSAQSFGVPNGPLTVTGLVPLPRKLSEGTGELELSASARIVAEASLLAEAQSLANVLRRSTGFELALAPPPSRAGDIELALAADPSSLGDEGYRLEVGDRVKLEAAKAAGAFYGTMTLRQLFAPEVEARATQAAVVWRLPEVRIEDSPAYAWRGLTLDVARHFWAVDEVKRLMLLAAYHKLNRFHLHLSDDQGWRIELKSWPKLTRVGAKSQVGGGPGGFYTQEQYADLVAFADAQHLVLIPELDMPGHVQAVLASYAELNKDGVAQPPYTGTDVGFSSLVFDDPDTLRFVDDAVREVAALTTGPYLHIGGDEAKATKPHEYRAFLKFASGVVHKYQKLVVGWCEAGEAELPQGTLLQDWHSGCAGSVRGVEQGLKLISSPAEHAYLDMKYTASTPKGQKWAGFVELQRAYEWQPSIPNVPDAAIVGIESALFTELIENRAEADYLIFPRLAGHAELAWSGAGHNFAEYRRRLAHHGRRLSALGVNFYRSPQVEWQN
jgi:hexosaminidase